MSKHIFQWAVYALLVLFVAGCGGTTSPGDDGGNSGGGGNGGGGIGNGNAGGGSVAAQMGSFNNSGDFVPGTIDSDTTTLNAGESAELRVAVVDGNGNFVTDPVDISFSSPCAINGLAAIDPTFTTTVNGQANVTYTARGCNGTDTITARAAANGTTLTASVILQTQTAPPASILFQSAVPEQIGLKGTGGALPEQSVITFKVTNAAGGPAPGKVVNFSLSTRTGGISLSTRQETTDGRGLVSTTVSSGTVPTAVRVTATTTTDAGQQLTAVSNALVITTGLPDNNSISLSAETLNIEGWAFNNITTELTVLLADRFNNPVPDGTAVTFLAEGGVVGASCQTVDGQCSVTFRSGEPRQPDGRVTILAFAIGEESFTDTNGDGLYNAGEPFVDLPEAFLDKNESGTHESGLEPFRDFNGDGTYTPANGQFDGLCEPGCPSNSFVHVRDSLVIVLSESNLLVSVSPATITLTTGGPPQQVTVTVQGSNGQVAPSGTTISAEVTQGELVGVTSYTQPNTNTRVSDGAGRFRFRIKPGSDAGNGLLFVTVTTPKGIISRGSANIIQSNPSP